VSVAPAAQVDGLQVKRDADVVGTGQWGSAVPVDPGKHVIAATAPGHVDWSTTVDVPESKTVEAVVPALAAAPVEVAKPAPPQTGTIAPAATPEGQDGAQSGARTRRNIGLLVAGAGVVAAGVGAYFGVQALSQNSDSNAQGCSGNVCRQPGYDLRSSARASGDLSSIFIGAGAAAFVAGAVLWLTAPSPKSATGSAAVVRVGLAPTGLRLEGVFR
jgi:hypothetical protein